MLELLQTYSEAAEVVKSYYLEKMLETLNSEDLPDNFKEFVREMGLENERLAKMVDSSPRALFDVFDENNLMIEISISGSQFSYKIFPRDAKFLNVVWYANRKEAEQAAVVDAFKTLDGTLKLKKDENRSDSESSGSEVPTEE